MSSILHISYVGLFITDINIWPAVFLFNMCEVLNTNPLFEVNANAVWFRFSSWIISHLYTFYQLREQPIFWKVPAGSVRSHRLCADAGCWSGRQQQQLMLSHHQITPNAPAAHRSSGTNTMTPRTRTAIWAAPARETSGASRATSVQRHAHALADWERTSSRTDRNDERGDLHCAADLCFSLRKRVPHGPPQDSFTPCESFHAKQCQRRARRPTAGITPTMWDRTAWRRRWAKDRQVSESPLWTPPDAGDAVRTVLGITAPASLTSRRAVAVPAAALRASECGE